MMRKRVGFMFAGVMLAILVLLGNMPFSAQASTARLQEPAPESLPGSGGTPVCAASHLALVSEPSIRLSSSAITGRSEFDWWWRSDGGFEAQGRAFAGELSILSCILNPNCQVLEVLRDLIFASSEAYGETQIDEIGLRLEGPPGARALIQTSGSVDGLLLGASVGIAEAKAKVVSDLYLHYPGGSQQLLHVDRTEYAYLLEQFSEHIQGSGTRTLEINTGDEIHLIGGIRAEAKSTFATTTGSSVSVSYFQNVYPTDQVTIPGLRITAKVLDTVPLISADESLVGASEGQLAANRGVYCDGDNDALVLNASIGTVVNHNNGTWSWGYPTRNGPRESQVVTITADDGKGGVAQTNFELVVENIPPKVDAGIDRKVYANETIILSGSWTDPAGPEDNPYLWTWDTNGDGTGDISRYASYGEVASVPTSFAAPGIYQLTFTARDRDGGWGSDTVQIEVINQPPVCGEAYPSQERLWPPNHQWVPVKVLGITDPEDDPFKIIITSIFQDEPVIERGSGHFSPDGRGVGTASAGVRAERSAISNGRVYHIWFEAQDSFGGKCEGEVRVSVPLANKKIALDDGALFDSTFTE